MPSVFGSSSQKRKCKRATVIWFLELGRKRQAGHRQLISQWRKESSGTAEVILLFSPGMKVQGRPRPFDSSAQKQKCRGGPGHLVPQPRNESAGEAPVIWFLCPGTKVQGGPRSFGSSAQERKCWGGPWTLIPLPWNEDAERSYDFVSQSQEGTRESREYIFDSQSRESALQVFDS